MKDKFDAVVLGLGAMGSAAIYQLAKRGKTVLGIDQFSPPHHYGSTHGESRIIRKAIGEGEDYVPLVLRSYELFREIEKETGKELLTITGGLTLQSEHSEAVMHGQPDFLDQAISCAQKFNIRHEVLETDDIKKRYPQFAVTNERGYFEYDTGFLRPELCLEAQLGLAQNSGAILRTDEKVISIAPKDDGRMIGITGHHFFHQRSASFCTISFLPSCQLVEHIESQGITDIQKGLIRWIMRTANGIHVHFFDQLYICQINGRANTSPCFRPPYMPVYSFHFDLHSI